MRATRTGAQVLWENGIPVVRFGQQWVQLWETRPIFPLQKSIKKEDVVKREITLSQVISVLGTDNISLNHVWFWYQVDDLDAETQRIVDIIQGSVHNLYEDPEGRKEKMRWLFVWDKDSDKPMCEIVLPDRSINMNPHMQFDVDTDLSPEKIASKIEGQFWDNFLDWHLDIDDVGRVVSMGTCDNRWTDVRIGIGSNLRSREAHRESMIKIS